MEYSKKIIVNHCFVLGEGAGALILEEDPYGLWEVCTRRLHRANRMLPHNVRNPDWN